MDLKVSIEYVYYQAVEITDRILDSYVSFSGSDPDSGHKTVFHNKRRRFQSYNDTNDSILEKYQYAESKLLW